MACSKYTLTNTGTTAINFNYRRCDDSMWEYQVNLNPNETKNIWLIDGTYSAAPSFQSNISLVNDGVYPLTPTPTPSTTYTPTPTPTAAVTPTVTPTHTSTPTPTTGVLTFTITSSDISQGATFNTYGGHDYPAVLGVNGTSGFTLTLWSGDSVNSTMPGNVPYIMTLSSTTIENFFNQLVTDGYIVNVYEDVMWTVDWASGSTYNSGYAVLSGALDGQNMYVCPLNTATTGWDGTNNYVANTALEGTFLLPATFTLVTPVVHKSGWC